MEKFLHPPKQVKKDISDVIKMDTSLTADPIELIKHRNDSQGDMGAPGGGTFEVENATELLMSGDGKQKLHQFFEVLSGVVSAKEKISILHYGDSQIEGDRITGFIRERIQSQFGGNGPGLIPATNVYNTYAFNQSYSKNFERYACFMDVQRIKSSKYGNLGSASRFTPEYENPDSILPYLEEKQGWIEVSSSNRAYTRARSFNNVRMHYNDCVAPVFLRVYENGNVIHEDSLIQDGNQHSVLLTFPETPGKLKFEFSGKISPNVCGFSLEGDYGVQVSNIAMRGSSGYVFGRMAGGPMSTMFSELNSKMVILQFGGNSVPTFKDSAGVVGFSYSFKNIIRTVQRMNPNAVIMVVGPSDMSYSDEGVFKTYELLPYCIEQMIERTKEAGAVYWNLYAAMGGYGSMHAWVEKGWAGSDHIHFTGGGTKVASQMMYGAIMLEYKKWKGEE